MEEEGRGGEGEVRREVRGEERWREGQDGETDMEEERVRMNEGG